jgi:hypothetical protein
VRAVEAFRPSDVDAAKHASDAAASTLSGDTHHDDWVRIVQGLLRRSRRRA